MLAQRLVERLQPGGTFIAASWLGYSEEHCISGDRAHEILRETVGLQLGHSERHDDFRLDVWTRTGSTAMETAA